MGTCLGLGVQVHGLVASLYMHVPTCEVYIIINLYEPKLLGPSYHSHID